MEINRENLEKVLNAELVGKDVGYSSYNFTGAANKVLGILVKEAGLNPNDFRCSSESAGRGCSFGLFYKNVCFGEVSYQKQKGEYRRGGYEWTFKKCFATFWNEGSCSRYAGLDFQGMLDKIDADLVANALKEAHKLHQAKEIFQMIKDYLATDDYGTRNFIDFLNKKKYSLTE